MEKRIYICIRTCYSNKATKQSGYKYLNIQLVLVKYITKIDRFLNINVFFNCLFLWHCISLNFDKITPYFLSLLF